MRAALVTELNSLQFDFSNLTPEKMTHIRDLVLEFTQAAFDEVGSLQNSVEPLTFATVIKPLLVQEMLCETPGENHMIFAMMKKVHPDPQVRAIANSADAAYQQLKLDCWQRADVFSVFTKYHATAYQSDKPNLDPEVQTFIAKRLTSYQREGLNLPINVQQEIKALQKRCIELSAQAEKNLAEVNTQFEYTRAQLTGLPETWFTERRLLRKGATPAADVFKVTLKYPDVFPITEYADNRQVRKEIYIAFNSQCADTNLAILAELVRLRAKIAQLLGFNSFADYKAQTRMAKDGQRISEFLQDLTAKFRSGLQQNLADLTALARAQTGDPDFVLESWDAAYYIRKRVKAKFAIDQAKIAEYFPYAQVETGIMRVYQDLLGLRFEKTAGTNAYHPEVACYDVFDAANNEKIGSFMLDMFPRDGKYTHACCEELVAGSEINLPLAILICNLPQDEGLDIGDVETFFHEFGHLMHCICSRRRLASMAGFNIELDAVEAPSQMLERWVYEPRVQKILSGHYKTGEPIPAELTENLVASERLHAAYEKSRQLMLATYDQEVHNLGEKATPENVLQLFQEIGARISGLSLAESKMPARFGHLFQDYAASYYGYLWALNIACDMYETVFAANPLDPVAGMHYRKTILEPGATKGFAELVKDFLGRDPIPEPFLRYCGIELPKPMLTSFGTSDYTIELPEVEAEEPAAKLKLTL